MTDVLLIEDNPDDAALAERAFAKLAVPARLTVAASGEEALSLLASGTTPRPGLILLDVKMARQDGHEVLRKLRALPLTRAVPVVMLSSSDQGRDIEDSYALGANSYLRKPVDFAAFVALIDDLCRYWLQHNRLPVE